MKNDMIHLHHHLTVWCRTSFHSLKNFPSLCKNKIIYIIMVPNRGIVFNSKTICHVLFNSWTLIPAYMAHPSILTIENNRIYYFERSKMLGWALYAGIRVQLSDIELQTWGFHKKEPQFSLKPEILSIFDLSRNATSFWI